MDGNPSRVALGRLLTTHRTNAGWTQRRLASEAFIDRSYVAHAESGRAMPGRHSGSPPTNSSAPQGS
ncbi:MAG: helix-turn-helix transcriptional regulator [Deltaproteobacteria bacterium]|nr:helix-turn-helix transcriptional regulator [Deltaproteobacteria bacterium]